MDIIDIDTLDRIGEGFRTDDRFYIESVLRHSELQKNKFNSLKDPSTRKSIKRIYRNCTVINYLVYIKWLRKVNKSS